MIDLRANKMNPKFSNLPSESAAKRHLQKMTQLASQVAALDGGREDVHAGSGVEGTVQVDCYKGTFEGQQMRIDGRVDFDPGTNELRDMSLRMHPTSADASQTQFVTYHDSGEDVVTEWTTLGLLTLRERGAIALYA